MAGRISVYILTGFLDSGKTTFLNGVLRSRTVKRRLILQFEEGETELEPDKNSKQIIWTLEDGETKDPAFRREMAEEIVNGGYEEIWIEWNGMVAFSELESLLLEKPVESLIHIAKVFYIADVTQANRLLKRFLVLVIPAVMMVVLPKDALQKGMQLTAGTDTMTTQAGGGGNTPEILAETVRQTDAGSTGATDQKETSTTTDTSGQEKKLPPGLDEENRTITVADEDFYDWVVQLCYYPDRYDGYTVHIHGTVYREDTMASNEFAVTRLLMTCCVADLSSFGPRCFLDDAQEIPVDTWVNVTGTYHYDTEKGMTITVTDWETAEPASEPYIYPTY